MEFLRYGYVRVSTDHQDPSSQLKVLMDMGIPHELIFVDRASGGIDPVKRSEFRKLLELIDKQKPDEIIVSEFSRIGRGIDQSLSALLELKKRGILIRSLSRNEDFINALPSDLQTFLISGMMYTAGIERALNTERTKRGIEKSQALGTKSGRPHGRPKVLIDWGKIEAKKREYGVSTNMARILCGYKNTTFYAELKKRNAEMEKQQNPVE